ncbi:MAG: hypothetical protein IJS39_06130 [Synergistaceae bacterium]|nr:hypothetical protein [Synergistaceae bacterium]
MNLMKKILCAVGVVALACSTAFGSVAINAATFPNATFRSYISANFDKNSDGTLSDAEIAKAIRVDIQGKGTMKLTGIEKLTALRHLYCDFSLAGNKFNYTSFKSTYGLTCDIDDSYFLVMHIEDKGRGGLMTPLTRDVADTSTGNYVLNMTLYGTQTLESIAFMTKGTPALEVHVAP